jgi:hypothetical protein
VRIGRIDPSSDDLGTSWRSVVSLTPLQFNPSPLPERASGTHRTRSWVGPRAGLDDTEKWKFFNLSRLELTLYRYLCNRNWTWIWRAKPSQVMTFPIFILKVCNSNLFARTLTPWLLIFPIISTKLAEKLLNVWYLYSYILKSENINLYQISFNTNKTYFVGWLLACTATRTQHSITKRTKNFILCKYESVEHLKQNRISVIKTYTLSLLRTCKWIKSFFEFDLREIMRKNWSKKFRVREGVG